VHIRVQALSILRQVTAQAAKVKSVSQARSVIQLCLGVSLPVRSCKPSADTTFLAVPDVFSKSHSNRLFFTLPC
jgi:hypothetical protein